MLIIFIYTCILPICDMFDEMYIMASRGLIQGLNMYLI